MRTVHILDLVKCFSLLTGVNKSLKLYEAGEKLGLRVSGNGCREIKGVASPEYPSEDMLCVVWDKVVMSHLPPEIPVLTREKYITEGRDALISENPRAVLAVLLSLFSRADTPHGISENAFVSSSAKVSELAYIADFAYVGDNCEIGSGTIIEPNAVLLHGVKTGKNCVIHSGAVLGCEGFGYERTETGIVKIPQTGGVKLGDNVEIGACTTIDRGTLDDTEIGSGTKIDNHVQIGHNVKIGRDCIICSMSGIAGSSKIGNSVTISVQAGITDHITVGDNVIIAGRSGVTHDIPSGAIISGFPARNHNDAKRALVLASDLPLLVKRLHNLERKVNGMNK